VRSCFVSPSLRPSVPPHEVKMNEQTKPAAALPEWHPAWSRELAELYYSGTINTFVLYGNVHDRLPVGGHLVWVGLYHGEAGLP